MNWTGTHVARLHAAISAGPALAQSLSAKGPDRLSAGMGDASSTPPAPLTAQAMPARSHRGMSGSMRHQRIGGERPAPSSCTYRRGHRMSRVRWHWPIRQMRHLAASGAQGYSRASWNAVTARTCRSTSPSSRWAAPLHPDGRHQVVTTPLRQSMIRKPCVARVLCGKIVLRSSRPSSSASAALRPAAAT